MSQPVPPQFKDIGKAANDLLNKDYPLAQALEVKTRAPNGIAFRTAASSTSGKGDILGEIEGKYTDVLNGVALTQTWTTANALRTQLELDNQLVKGLKLEAAGLLLPAAETGNKGLSFAATYKQPAVNTKLFVDALKGPTFTGDLVIGRNGFLVGGQSIYSADKGQLKAYSLGLGYAAPTYSATIHALNSLGLFQASYYQQINRDVEAGAKAIWNKSVSSNVALEFGGKAYLDNTAFVKAKVNNSGLLVLGYTQALRPGVKGSIGLALDTVKLASDAPNGPAHKIGSSLTFEA